MILDEMFNSPKQDTVVFAFGRFQPPTTGHGVLVDKVKQIAENHNAAYAVYVSKTQDKKTNPLSIDIKMQYLTKMFPGINFVAADSNVRTFVEAAKHLNQTYRNLIMIAGSDRIQAFNKVLHEYNGKEFHFENIKVMSAGERDPDSDGPSGMSGSKMREAAINNDIASFMQGMPSSMDESSATELMHYVQQGLAPMKKFTKKPVIGLNEGPELKSTLRAITNDIGEPVLQLYSTMRQMAKQFHANKGDLKGFQMVAAGAAKRWYDTFYFNKLGKELRHLTQQSPRHSASLNAFLSKLPPNFSALANELPEILLQIGTQIGDTELARKSKVWIQTREQYNSYLDSLEVDSDDEYNEPVPKTPKNALPGQQNAQVDKIVNDVLSKLSNNISGDIRNAIARSPNKLQALQSELQKRGVKVPMGEGFPYDVDHQPGAVRNDIAKQMRDSACKRCHGAQYIYKTPDGKVFPDNKVGSLRYKCGACKGTGFTEAIANEKQIPISEDIEKTMYNLIRMLESK